MNSIGLSTRIPGCYHDPYINELCVQPLENDPCLFVLIVLSPKLQGLDDLISKALLHLKLTVNLASTSCLESRVCRALGKHGDAMGKLLVFCEYVTALFAKKKTGAPGCRTCDS